MGASGYFGYGRWFAESNVPEKKNIIRKLVYENVHRGRCVRDTIVKGVYYGIYENSARTHRNFALVVQTHVRGDELIVRYETEDMGPYNADMPVSYLKLLGPPDNQYSAEWRKRVVANAKRKSVKRK